LTLLDGLQIGLPRTTQPAEHEEDDPTSRQRFLPPQPMHGDEACYDKLRGVTLTRFLGTSVLLVPPMTLVCAHPESKLLSVGPGGDNDSRGDTTTKTGAVTTGNEVRTTLLASRACSMVHIQNTRRPCGGGEHKGRGKENIPGAVTASSVLLSYFQNIMTSFS
jgi:hypothetical protein